MKVAVKFEMPVSFANLNHAPQVSPFHVQAVKQERAYKPTRDAKFEVGKTYFTRSICDHDTIYKIEIVRRTAKSIWTKCGKQLRVSLNYDNNESVKPHGNYSMCAIISADRVFEN